MFVMVWRIEIIKMAVTDDPVLFNSMKIIGPRLLDSHFATVEGDEELEEIADEVIYRALFSYGKHEWASICLKPTKIVLMALTRHTWSPRFEPTAELMHGHAVSIGMALWC